VGNPSVDDKAIWRSLRSRGYLKRVEPSKGKFIGLDAAQRPEEDDLRKAVIALQKMYGLPETGEIDEAVRAFLLNPHCTVPDPDGPAALRAGNVPWKSPNLTYQFMSWPPNVVKVEVRSAFRSACDTWEAVCSLRFKEVAAKGDMRIHFGSGAHNCKWPFDAAGGTLAHAFYPDWEEPLNGDIHVDTSETWSVAMVPAAGTKDLEAVLLHEIGHAVGLVHNASPDSIMFANYNGPIRRLGVLDEANIKQLY
jgi:hypothetical protein